MNLWVYDIETYPNFFLAVFYNVKDGLWKQFEISSRKYEVYELHEFLLSGIKLIGFNNINFDYPVIHNTILSFNKLDKIDARVMYNESQRVISQKYSAIWPNKTIVPQLDLFKIWHYDNKNKSTSLKWLEFAMRSEDIRDLPYAPGTELTTKQMDEITSYCKHDVLETYKFYTKSLKHIKIREFYSAEENLNLINASEITLAKEIFTKYLAIEMGMSPWDVKKLRTHRDKVPIKDVIFDYIKFEDPINQKTLDHFKSLTWIDTSEMSETQKKKHAISFDVNYKNITRTYAIGGLHSFGQKGIYETNDTHILVDLDFASFYPHICFKNGLHPAHIPPKIFNELYEGFYHQRKLYPKSDPRNYVLKIVLNGSYGLSKDKYSMLYDPKWQLEIVINGQLLLTMLTEKILQKCKHEVKIIFENTDGAMYYINREDLDNIKIAANEMESICSIPLEIQECKKIVAHDVNNYINIIENDYYKFKGAFEIDRDYHKNHSSRIIPIALANYFINGINPASTIRTHYLGADYKFATNYQYYDFCLAAKMTGSNELFKRKITGKEIFSKQDKRDFVELYGFTQLCRDFYIKDNKGAHLDDIFKICYENSHLKIDEPLTKTTRYYISNEGYQLIKKMPFLKRKYNSYKKDYITKHKKKWPKEDFNIVSNIEIILPHRETNIESGYLCTVVNKMPKEFDINYDYYITQCNKIIESYNV